MVPDGVSVVEGDGVEVPGGVGEPLFAPAPVFIFAGDAEAEVEVDVVGVGEAAGDAVDDAAGGVGVFVGFEEHVGDVVAAGGLEHAGVEGVLAEDPVELVPGVGLEGVVEGFVVGEMF